VRVFQRRPGAIRSEEFISLASAVNSSTIDSTTMRRMVILSSGDLSRSFRTALNTLADAGIQMQPGTKLLTRYAVIVVDETAIDGAIAQLQTAGIKVQKDLP
jgi:hypothetical protein